MKIVLFFSLLLSISIVPMTSIANTRQSEQKIVEFVEDWFLDFDQFAKEEDFLEKLSTENLQMIFPETTIKSHEDFKAWYRGVAENISQASHEIRSISILSQDRNGISLAIKVLWKAQKFNGEKIEFQALQNWTLINGKGGLKIKKYVVTEDQSKELKFSLKSFLPSIKTNEASLKCVCYGGPGNYRYDCAPIAKTCYGGPGNYPYACSVCP